MSPPESGIAQQHLAQAVPIPGTDANWTAMLLHSRHSRQQTRLGAFFVYGCLSLQVFCGMLARIEQFADVMRDSKLQIKKVNDVLAAVRCHRCKRSRCFVPAHVS